MSRNPTVAAVNKWSRKLHRWGAVATAPVVVLVVVTGLLLQVKKYVPWVQPPTARGSAPGAAPAVSMEALLTAAKGVPGAGIGSWADVQRVDVQPQRGIAKLTGPGAVEVQVDLSDGRVLHVAERRSDLIESLHDGSFFSEPAKVLVFLPAGVVLLGLWVTGVYLWALPVWARRRGNDAGRRGPVGAAG